MQAIILGLAPLSNVAPIITIPRISKLGHGHPAHKQPAIAHSPRIPKHWFDHIFRWPISSTQPTMHPRLSLRGWVLISHAFRQDQSCPRKAKSATAAKRVILRYLAILAIREIDTRADRAAVDSDSSNASINRILREPPLLRATSARSRHSIATTPRIPKTRSRVFCPQATYNYPLLQDTETPI